MLRSAMYSNCAVTTYVLLLMTKRCDYGALVWVIVLDIIWGGDK
jgi:hypothetical protein